MSAILNRRSNFPEELARLNHEEQHEEHGRIVESERGGGGDCPSPCVTARAGGGGGTLRLLQRDSWKPQPYQSFATLYYRKLPNPPILYPRVAVFQKLMRPI